MGTKILNVAGSVTGNATFAEFGSGLGPSGGLTWTSVEFRPYFQGKGDAYLFLDDEQYDQVASEDVATYGQGHVVALAIVSPSLFHIKFSDRSGATNFCGADLTIEETKTSGGAP